MGRFVIKGTADGRWMFNLLANNNRVICTSQVYASVANCKVGIDSIRRNCGMPVDDLTRGEGAYRNPKYEVFFDVGGRYRFRLRAANGEIIAASQAYADRGSCMKGIRSVAKHAPDAEEVVVRPDTER